MLVYDTLDRRWKGNPSASFPDTFRKKLWEGVRNSGMLQRPREPRSAGMGTGRVRSERPPADISSMRLTRPGGLRPVHFSITWDGRPGDGTRG